MATNLQITVEQLDVSTLKPRNLVDLQYAISQTEWTEVAASDVSAFAGQLAQLRAGFLTEQGLDPEDEYVSFGLSNDARPVYEAISGAIYAFKASIPMDDFSGADARASLIDTMKAGVGLETPAIRWRTSAAAHNGWMKSATETARDKRVDPERFARQMAGRGELTKDPGLNLTGVKVLQTMRSLQTGRVEGLNDKEREFLAKEWCTQFSEFLKVLTENVKTETVHLIEVKRGCNKSWSLDTTQFIVDLIREHCPVLSNLLAANVLCLDGDEKNLDPYDAQDSFVNLPRLIERMTAMDQVALMVAVVGKADVAGGAEESSLPS